MPTRHGISRRSFCTTGSIWLQQRSCAEEICFVTVNGRSRLPMPRAKPATAKGHENLVLHFGPSQRTQLRTQTSHLNTAREIRNTTFCCTKFQSALILCETHGPFLALQYRRLDRTSTSITMMVCCPARSSLQETAGASATV